MVGHGDGPGDCETEHVVDVKLKLKQELAVHRKPDRPFLSENMAQLPEESPREWRQRKVGQVTRQRGLLPFDDDLLASLIVDHILATAVRIDMVDLSLPVRPHCRKDQT